MLASFMEAALAGIGAVLVMLLILAGLVCVLCRGDDKFTKDIEKWRDGK